MTTRTQTGKVQRKTYSNKTRPYVKQGSKKPKKETNESASDVPSDEEGKRKKSLRVKHLVEWSDGPDSMQTIEWNDNDQDERIFGQHHTQGTISTNQTKNTLLVRYKTI